MENKFYVGQRVKCPNFGKGIVSRIENKERFSVFVCFDNDELDEQVYMEDGRLYTIFLPTLEPDEPEVIEWPEGMNYLSTDSNGLRYFFKNKPDINETKKEWYPVEWDDTDYPLFVFKPNPCPNWRESLIKREK